jgi:hypothetical protein
MPSWAERGSGSGGQVVLQVEHTDAAAPQMVALGAEDDGVDLPRQHAREQDLSGFPVKEPAGQRLEIHRAITA